MAQREEKLDELKVKLDILLKRYHALEKYKEEAVALKKENEELKKIYADLLNATSFSGNKANIKEAKLYVSRLIREIDKCIALLSA